MLGDPGGRHMSTLQADSAASLGKAFPAVLLLFPLPEREQTSATLLLVSPLLPTVLLRESGTEQIPEL